MWENTIVQIRMLEMRLFKKSELAFASTNSCILSTVVAQTLVHRFPLKLTKLEHETARNYVSKPGEDLRIHVFLGCTRPPKLQRNAFRDCRWYDDGSPGQR